jgi:hypothetical protein
MDDAVRLRALGMSYRSIARELGMSLGGVQRALRKAGVVPGQPATQVVEDRDTEITAELSHLLDGDDVDMLSLWRLAHLMAPADFALLGERIHTTEFAGINTAIARS